MNWLEVAKLAVSALTPLTVALVGYWISRSIKNVEESQWHGRKLVEKRLDLFDQLAPDLNRTFCFITWVGDWKDTSPVEMILAKRRLDKLVHIYRGILGEEFFTSYDTYMGTIFQTYSGRGMDACILAKIANYNGDRRTDGRFDWEPAMEECFDEQSAASENAVRQAYISAMVALRNSIGLKSLDRPKGIMEPR